MNTAQRYIGLGLSVIPCVDKIPSCSWKKYQSEIVAADIAEHWTGDIGIICGAVSGGLVCIDFDVKNGDKWGEWVDIADDTMPGLLMKLVVELTPSGGYHVIYRTDQKIGNVQLAKNKEKKATIETRGEGGYFVCTPAKGYRLFLSDFDSIAVLTAEEHDFIISSCRSLNELIIEDRKEEQRPVLRQSLPGDITPFDDFDSRNDVVALLQSHGWTPASQRGEITYFRRPGKTGPGISASWNKIPGRLYVFTTSTFFENEHIYKPSAVYSILNHGGDWSAAARDLYAQGYGSRKNHNFISEQVKTREAKLINLNDIGKELDDIAANGYPKGKTTGWKNVDELYSVIKGQFTVVTGYPSSGKSEWMDALAMNMAMECGWKFAVFSPENYPVRMHCHKLAEKYVGLPLRGPMAMSQDNRHRAGEFIKEHFFFIDALEEDVSLENILDQTLILIKNEGIDGLIIDPFNEIELCKPKDISDTEFIGNSLRKTRKFARRNNIHLWIVAHPTKPMKLKDGTYPVVELYDIQGSSHWRNKADNGITVHRNFEDDTIKIITQKIKFRYTGKMGDCTLIFNKTNGKYEETVAENSYNNF